MALTKKDTLFVWTTPCKKSFRRCKESSVSAPILRHFDIDRNIVVETDAFTLIVTGVLSQLDDDDILHPVAYFSRKHSLAEIHYEIFNKELLAIIRAFKEWCPLLKGSPYTITVIFDYRNLTYFITNHLVNYH
jgi:hypothetical protein